MPRAVAPGPRVGLEDRSRSGAAGAPRRRQAAANRTERGRARGQRQRGPVDADLAEARHLERGRRDREAQARVRDGHADDAAEPGEEGALGEDVPYQVPGAAPKGAPDRELVPPVQPARRQQARHVDARHQQHRRDRGQQPSQRGAHVAGDLQVEGRDDGRDGERGLTEGVAGQRGQLRARLLDRDPRRKTHDRRVVELAESARLLGRVAERLEDLRRTAAAGRQRREPIQVGKPERLGEHADHLDPLVVQREHAPDDARIAAERPLPDVVGENRDAGLADGGVGGPEPPAEGRRHAEQVEEVRRHLRTPQIPGLARIRQGRPGRTDRRDTGAGVPAPGPRLDRPQVGGKRGEPVLHLADVDLHGDELARVLERQRRQEHAVDEGKDRGRRPDTQPEHRDHDGGESGGAAQPPGHVTQVPAEAVEPAPPPDGARLFPDEGRVPEPSAGGAGRGLGGDAGVRQPLALELHVQAHLVLEVLVRSLAAEVGNDAEKPSQPRHRSTSSSGLLEPSLR